MFSTMADRNGVDCTGENGNASGAAGSLRTPNASDAFERSCDNPECSAPKLISQAPKHHTSEFITDPVVMNKPTLVNGFTTIFQIDGAATRMEDLMNESVAAQNGSGPNNSKTVFRIVPNTHAHIVNYVVVDAASDTMEKIKANDPETIRKLLVSQRLSAEQMLKKLIGKAFESAKQSESKESIRMFTEPPTSNATDEAPSSTSQSRSSSIPLSEPSLVSSSTNIPSTSTQIPDPLPTSSKIGISKPKLPPGITIKILPSNATISKSPSPSPSTKQIPKTISSLIQKPKSTPSNAIGGRNISASKPVVWQAVPPGTSLKSGSTPIRITPPKTVMSTSPSSAQTVIFSTSKARSPLNNSPILPFEETEVIDVEKSIKANSIPAYRIPDNEQNLKRKSDFATLDSETVKRLRPGSPNRTQSLTPLASNLARLNNSPPPTRKLPVLPKNYKPPPPLCTTKRYLIGPQHNDDDVIIISDPDNLKSDLISNKKETEVKKDDNTTKPSSPATSDISLRRKGRPLMGPASKMRALKSIAETELIEDSMTETKSDSNSLQSNDSSLSKSSLISETKTIKIGETIITRTGVLKGNKETPKTVELLTRPCSVAVTDIAKSKDSDNNESRTKRVKPTLRSSSEKETNKSTKTNQAAKSDQDLTKNSKTNQALIDKLRGRWAFRKEVAEKSLGRTTRSSAPLRTVIETVPEEISDSALLTTPSAPSRVLRVVLPSKKNGIIQNSPSSPHPNLKISSVISGGAALSATLHESRTETVPVIIDDSSSEPGIEQLQKELADLRRTVARLTHGKKSV